MRHWNHSRIRARLPWSIQHLALVVHLADIQPVDDVVVAVRTVAPSPRPPQHWSAEAVIEVVGEYVMVSWRHVDLSEEGTHRFEIQLRRRPVVSLEIPVRTTHEPEVAPLQ